MKSHSQGAYGKARNGTEMETEMVTEMETEMETLAWLCLITAGLTPIPLLVCGRS